MIKCAASVSVSRNLNDRKKRTAHRCEYCMVNFRKKARSVHYNFNLHSLQRRSTLPSGDADASVVALLHLSLHSAARLGCVECRCSGVCVRAAAAAAVTLVIRIHPEINLFDTNIRRPFIFAGENCVHGFAKRLFFTVLLDVALRLAARTLEAAALSAARSAFDVRREHTCSERPAFRGLFARSALD